MSYRTVERQTGAPFVPRGARGYLPARSARPILPFGGVVELPTSHRVPLRWLLEHGGETIKYRTLREIAPPLASTPDELQALVAELPAGKGIPAIVKRQKETGIWGANLLATGPVSKDGIKEAGTIPQYRRLLQLGLPTDRSEEHTSELQ